MVPIVALHGGGQRVRIRGYTDQGESIAEDGSHTNVVVQVDK